jgi:hypothetical protein
MVYRPRNWSTGIVAWTSTEFPVFEQPGSRSIANVSAEMSGDDIERTALELIKLYRSGAAQIARDLAEIGAARHHDQPSAETWRSIAEAIERLWPKP